MNIYLKTMAVLVSLASLSEANAAELSVPSHSSVQVSADAALHKLLPADIAKRGYIVAATNPNTPPTTFFESDNKTLAGREIDVMNAVAERLGVKVLWRDSGGFDNIIPGLVSLCSKSGVSVA